MNLFSSRLAYLSALITVLLFFSSAQGQIPDSTTSGTAKSQRLDSVNSEVKVELGKMFEKLNPEFLFEGYKEDIKSMTDILPSTKPQLESEGIGSRIIRKSTSFVEDNTQVNGTVRIESFVSGRRMPYQLSESKYIRVYASPQIQLFGLPFQTDFYYTTENNTYYNSNSFGFHFNPAQIRNHYEQQAEERLDASKKDLQENKVDQQRLSSYLNDMSRMLQNEKRNLSGIESRLAHQSQKLKQVALDSAQAYQTAIRNHARDSLNTLHTNAKDSVALDSIKARQQEFAKRKEQAQEAYAQLDNQYQKSKAIIDQFDNYYQLGVHIYDILQQKDSIYEAAIGFMKYNLDSIKNSTGSKVRNVFEQNAFVQSIRQLDLGTSNPYLSDNTINGIPVRGINFETQYQNSFVQVIGGRTISDFSYSNELDSSTNLFSRNIAGIKIGKGSRFGNQIYLVSASLWDGKSQQQSSNNITNHVSGFGFQYAPLKAVSLRGEFLASSYKRFSGNTLLNNQRIDLSQNLSFGDRIALRSSVDLELTGNIDQNTEVVLKVDQKKHGFRSLGTPFHRTDYRQLDARFNKKLFKNQIRLSTFYKNFTNNLSETSNTTNSLKGLGFSASSSFRKKPNFQITHLPYEQGNNHTDTLLRTNNRLATTIISINYRKSFKYHRFTWVGSYTNSQVEYFQLGNQVSSTKVFSLSQVYERQRATITTTLLRSQVTPTVDTLNFTGANLLITFRKRQNHFNLSSQIKYTSQSSMMTMSSVGYKRKLLQGLQISVNGSLQYIKGYWGIEELYVPRAMASITYTINPKPIVFNGS